ncbi:MAG: UvrB/UvrC motif-containing protein [bacterium]|nr:UvrB/UvrC motif-containing protein [bacterium]
MNKFKFSRLKNISELPRGNGVYCFKNKRENLYIGKASNLRERIKNHFLQSTYRDNLFINLVKKIGFIETNSEIEALLLESQLIKQCQPKYNVMWKDDKNYFYIGVTKEELPRVFITHQIEQKTKTIYIGPFVEGTALKKALKTVRKIFPYYTAKNHPPKPCLWCHLRLCPGPDPVKSDYQKNIKNLVLFLRGKKLSVLKNLKREMGIASEREDYEKAARFRDQIGALENILSYSKIFPLPPSGEWEKTAKWLKDALRIGGEINKIEAYDVSNIQGQEATASMVTFVRGLPDKNLYRKFKIKISGSPNDIAMLKEALSRRFSHPEWPNPELILIDGGKAQLNIAIKVKIQNPQLKNIRIVSLAKKHNELFIEGRKNPLLLEALPREIFNLILQLRDEAHRFAISYHKKLRERVLLKK